MWLRASAAGWPLWIVDGATTYDSGWLWDQRTSERIGWSPPSSTVAVALTPRAASAATAASGSVRLRCPDVTVTAITSTPSLVAHAAAMPRLSS